MASALPTHKPSPQMEQPPGGTSGHGSGEGGGVAWLPPVGTPLNNKKKENVTKDTFDLTLFLKKKKKNLPWCAFADGYQIREKTTFNISNSTELSRKF
mmetsp:Transcript_2455/g.3587  ORF Transcript_2455/g.3587 Transcript_2455/m.3587 type:complete len:98 (+) Transcript_2455:1211-1504(+)